MTKLSVSAATEDEDATYIITDTNLKVGKNVIDIKVTAQDGTVRWYAIRVTRESAETTEADTTEATTGAPTTEAQTEEPATEATTPADPLEVVIGSITGRVQESLNGVDSPEGYEKKKYSFNGVEIEALKGLANGLVLIPISDGTKTSLYIYNESNGGLYPYVGIQITSALYTVLPFAEDEQMPNGYKRTVVEFNGSLIDAWIREDAETGNYVLFYAMNWEGTSALYRYDAEEKTLQRVNKDEIAVPTTEESAECSTENTDEGTETITGANSGNQSGSEVNSQYIAYYEEQLEKINRRDTIMFIVMVVLLLCLIAMYLIFSSGKKENPDSDPDDEVDEDDADYDDTDEDDDSEGYDIEALLDSLDDGSEVSDHVQADQAEQLEKELEDIQLGMAGIVASFELEEAAAENLAAENMESEALKTETGEPENLDAPVSEEADSKADDLEVDDLEVDDLEVDDLEVDELDVDDPKEADPEVDDFEVDDFDLDDLELEDIDLDDLETADAEK